MSRFNYPNPNYKFDRPIENGNMAKSLRQKEPIKLDNYVYYSNYKNTKGYHTLGKQLCGSSWFVTSVRLVSLF